MKTALSFLLFITFLGPLFSKAACDPCICGLGGGKPPPVECMNRPQPIIFSCQSEDDLFSLTRFHGTLHANLISKTALTSFIGRAAVTEIPTSSTDTAHFISEDNDVDVQVNFNNLAENSIGSVLIREFDFLNNKTIICKASRPH
ncbi:hypothetical protein D3C87_144470 [compost metagenome]